MGWRVGTYVAHFFETLVQLFVADCTAVIGVQALEQLFHGCQLLGGRSACHHQASQLLEAGTLYPTALATSDHGHYNTFIAHVTEHI